MGNSQLRGQLPLNSLPSQYSGCVGFAPIVFELDVVARVKQNIAKIMKYCFHDVITERLGICLTNRCFPADFDETSCYTHGAQSLKQLLANHQQRIWFSIQ